MKALTCKIYINSSAYYGITMNTCYEKISSYVLSRPKFVVVFRLQVRFQSKRNEQIVKLLISCQSCESGTVSVLLLIVFVTAFSVFFLASFFAPTAVSGIIVFW